MSKTVGLNPGFRGFVSIVVNATFEQHVFLEVKKTDGTPVASATFEGVGVRVHARDIFNGREYWSFGPFTYNAILSVTIKHKRGGQFVPSKMVGPLEITKEPEPDYPMLFHVGTVISEDMADNSHDDCTVQVLRYRDIF